MRLEYCWFDRERTCNNRYTRTDLHQAQPRYGASPCGNLHVPSSGAYLYLDNLAHVSPLMRIYYTSLSLEYPILTIIWIYFNVSASRKKVLIKMSIQRFAIAFLTLISAWAVVSYPQTRSGRSLSVQSRVLPDTDEPAHEFHAPNAPLSLRSPPSSAIRCFAPKAGIKSPTVDGCRPTLNEIRTFPRYRVTQYFEDNKWPKEPTTPPFMLHHYQSDCIVRLGTNDPRKTDRFSYYQFREIATEIVESCHDFGSLGGVAPIGRGVGWTVRVLGTQNEPSLSVMDNSTVMFMNTRVENGTDES